MFLVIIIKSPSHYKTITTAYESTQTVCIGFYFIICFLTKDLKQQELLKEGLPDNAQIYWQ